jgi:hypothetical protein
MSEVISLAMKGDNDKDQQVPVGLVFLTLVKLRADLMVYTYTSQHIPSQWWN